MRATFQTRRDGTIALQLDDEAARAVFASILFASRFHENIAVLAAVAKQGLERTAKVTPGRSICR
jgi:hypothetical protein